MDTSLEVINVLKKLVQLHVIIEVTEKSKNQNIIDIEALPEDVIFGSPESLLSSISYNYMKPYIEGTASANFLIYKKGNISSYAKSCFQIYKYIGTIKPDILHLEAMLIRSFCLLPSLFKFKKIFLGIHDPLPHKGEKEIKLNLLRSLFLKNAKTKGIFFYSEFSKGQFENHYKNNHSSKWVVKMCQLTYFKNFVKNKATIKNSILFFGRISPYKGIDVLLNAIPDVFNTYPHEHLIIAGRSINDYKISSDALKDFSEKITILNKHISNEELVQLISKAKFVVCPYIEATQSGVLMTSFALNTPVIASAVGAFTEYIDENENGALVPVNDSDALSAKIKSYLKDDYYTGLSNNMERDENSWKLNKNVFLDAYKD